VTRARASAGLVVVVAACGGALSAVQCGDGTRILLGEDRPDAAVESLPFGAPILVAELGATGRNDFKETLTDDRLEIYFVSDRPGGPGSQDVWVSTRPSADATWSPPSCVVEVSSPQLETGAAVSGDGLSLWLGSSRSGGRGGVDIWLSTRPDRQSAWSTPTPVVELNTTNDEYPRPTALAGLLMLPSYRAPPNDKYQTYTTSRPALDASWVTAIAVPEVNTSTIDTDAFLREDGLVLYFSSDRTGDQDLFVARRVDLTAPFTGFAAIAELNTTGHAERDPWLSRDGHEIYFSSDRDGSLKIYRAVR
jgi:hypothetical protein